MHTGKGKSNDINVPFSISDQDKRHLEGRGYRFDEKDGGPEIPIRDDDSMKRLKALMERVHRRFAAKQPIYREAATFREEVATIWATLPHYDWFSELADDPGFRKMNELREGAEPDLQSTMMTWISQKLRTVSDTSNWFRPTEGLTYKLLATDLKGSIIGDLKLPMDAFYIELPPGIFYNEDRTTGWHEVRALTVVKGRITERTIAIAKKYGDIDARTVEMGDRLIIEAYAEPNQNSANPFDDSWLFKSYRIEGQEEDIETVIEKSVRGDGDKERALNRGRIGARTLDGVEIRVMLLKFVLNLCIYLGSEKVTKEHVHEKEIERLHKGRKFKNLRHNVQQKIRDLQNDRVFVVGTDVEVDHEFKEMVLTEGTSGFKLTYRTLVRGHWRNQAHGPQRSLRTRKWIQPHVRGADLPGKTVGHTYDME
jgi:hypothetical protein